MATLQVTEKQAKYSNVYGASIELFGRNDNDTDWDTTSKQLCGINTLSYSDGGSGEEIDITDFCWGLKGTKRKISGLSEEGSLNVGVSIFDPEQEGQKYLNELPKNSRVKMVIKFPYGDNEEDIVVLELETRKVKNADFSLEVGKVWNGNWQLAVTAEPVFKVE